MSGTFSSSKDELIYIAVGQKARKIQDTMNQPVEVVAVLS